MRRTTSVLAHTSHAAGLLDFAFLANENFLASLCLPRLGGRHMILLASQTVNHNLAEQLYGLRHNPSGWNHNAAAAATL